MDEPGDKEPAEAILRCPAEERTPDNIEATAPAHSQPGIHLHNSQISIGKESEGDSEH